MKENNPWKYYVTDSKTGDRVSIFYKTSKAAHKKADKLDLEYGAVRFMVQCTLWSFSAPNVDRIEVK